MSDLIFDQKSLLDGNIFKFEERLHTKLNRFASGGSILVDYFSQDETSTTVDRGTKDIDQLFGRNSPLRYNEIIDLPLNGFGQANPENTDEIKIEDINVEGDCMVLPTTVVPKNMDFFIINHLKMCALFEVTDVTFDSMKVDGFYKIHYRLHSTSPATIEKLRNQVLKVYHTDMNEIGGTRDAVILEDDFVYREKVISMMNMMIDSYRSLFYNDRHNCFLYHDLETGKRWFDMCGNEFIAKHGLMNAENSMNVIMLHQKIDDPKLPLYYNQSVYAWLELHAPARLIQKFPFRLEFADMYPYSSFVQWYEGDIQIMHPINTNQANDLHLGPGQFFFDGKQVDGFLDTKNPPKNEYEKLIWNYIHNTNINIHDVSLYLGDALISSINQKDVFLYTPIMIYIIRSILDLK